MPITRKPQSSTTASSNVDVDALISKGGGIAQRATELEDDDNTTSAVILRIPNRLLKRIDQALVARPLKLPRHTWLLEAVLEKLEREKP